MRKNRLECKSSKIVKKFSKNECISPDTSSSSWGSGPSENPVPPGCSTYNMGVTRVQAYLLVSRGSLADEQQYPAGRDGTLTGPCSKATPASKEEQPGPPLSHKTRESEMEGFRGRNSQNMRCPRRSFLEWNGINPAYMWPSKSANAG